MPEPDAAVAIVRSVAPESSILLIRRAERDDDPWSGHWSLPGGRREPGDADLLDTALRELAEECGIELAREACEGSLCPAVARRQTGRFLLVAPYQFAVDGQLPTVLDPREAAASGWIPLDLLRDPTRHHLRSVPGRPTSTLYPAVDLEGPPLWGFTYRLITDWLGLTPENPAPDAGFAAAREVLGFLTGSGLGQVSDWNGRTVRVSGPIPVEAVLAHYSTPGPYVFAVQRLEIHHYAVRVAGLGYEEYVIEAVTR